MRRHPQRDDAAQPEKKSVLVPIILTISAVLHVGVLGYAALLPPPAPVVDPNVRVQVMQWQHDEAADNWGVQGTRWARVSRERLRASGL